MLLKAQREENLGHNISDHLQHHQLLRARNTSIILALGWISWNTPFPRLLSSASVGCVRAGSWWLLVTS